MLDDQFPPLPVANPTLRRTMARRFAGLAIAATLVVGGVDAAGGQESIDDARSQREQVREERAAAAAELDAARADDREIQAALEAINESVLAQQNALADAQRQLDVAHAVAEQASADVLAAEARIADIRARLAELAVSGFVGDEGLTGVSYDYLSAENPADAMRRATMLQLANTDAPDLLEQMRVVEEDADIAQAIADNAVEQAAVLEADMAAILVDLEEQQAVQAALKAELDARIAEWEETVAEFAAEEAALSEFIRAEEAKAIPPPPPPAAGAGGVSASGFQWPISAYVTSEYGWRIHPIYGTKRLHAGIDLGAGTGTPIAASAGGTVIHAGPYGGYGNAVIINHGNGITTLYAHQSKIAVSTGQQVGRGEVIGYVGSTGNSTGPHLHFEVRVNGSAVNPRGYLP
ncbi:MAG: peptidoglycan DD-metalloendopeptidase family protein [Acidimicrobiales bacterium]